MGLALGHLHYEGPAVKGARPHERTSRLRQHYGGVVSRRTGKKAQVDQLVNEGAQLRHGRLLHDAVRAQGVVAARGHLLCAGPAKHVDDGGGARKPSTLGKAGHARDHLEGVRGGVNLLELRQAVAAVAAIRRRLLAKVAQDEGPQAVRRGGIEGHLLQAPGVVLPDLLQLLRREVVSVLARLGEKELLRVDVTGGVEQQALGRGAVPAGASRLLVVVLQAAGHVVVHHVADV